MTGGSVTASLDFIETPSEWARNVVAVIPGSDPVLKHEYVAIGAHNDHIGMTAVPVDHDSLKAFNDARNKMLIANNMIALTPAQLQSIQVNMDSVRKLHPIVRARFDQQRRRRRRVGLDGHSRNRRSDPVDESETQALDSVRLAHG